MHVTHRWGLLRREAGATPTEAASRAAGRADGELGCPSTVLSRTWALDHADLGSRLHFPSGSSCDSGQMSPRVTTEDPGLHVLGPPAQAPRPVEVCGPCPRVCAQHRGEFHVAFLEEPLWSCGQRCHPFEASDTGARAAGVPLGVGEAVRILRGSGHDARDACGRPCPWRARHHVCTRILLGTCRQDRAAGATNRTASTGLAGEVPAWTHAGQWFPMTVPGQSP